MVVSSFQFGCDGCSLLLHLGESCLQLYGLPVVSLHLGLSMSQFLLDLGLLLDLNFQLLLQLPYVCFLEQHLSCELGLHTLIEATR